MKVFLVMSPTRVLAICSRNQWRSPTAEKLINQRTGFEARSAGTEPSARIRVTRKLIEWADITLVMEQRHRRRLEEQFAELMPGKVVHCLDIPDNYRFMDPELVELLNDSIDELVSES